MKERGVLTMSSSGFDITGLDEFERNLIKVISQKYPKEAKKFLQKCRLPDPILDSANTPISNRINNALHP